VNITVDVLDQLRSCEVDGIIVRMPQMQRDLYMKVNRVLTALGGRWSRKLKGHMFEDNPGDRLNDAVTMGKVTDPKKEFQFFETPYQLAERMVDLADIQACDSLLEPSAGDGAIVAAIQRRFNKRTVHVAELDRGHEKKLGRFKPFITVHWGNFLDAKQCMWDKIIANPPFSKGQDVDHVSKMMEVLRPGGKIVTITSPGWTFRNDKRHETFRNTMNGLRLHGLATWEKLDSGTFKTSGTMVNSILLTIGRGMDDI